MNLSSLITQVPSHIGSDIKNGLHAYVNRTHGKDDSTHISDGTVVNLLLVQLLLLGILCATLCCYHPCMAFLPWNCYDPLRFRGHASWMHRILRLVREVLLFALGLGVLILASMDDCSRRVTHILCKAGDQNTLLRQAFIWVTFGIVCVIVKEICRDSPFCSEAARYKDMDDRLLRLRHGRNCCGSFCKRANVTTRIANSNANNVDEIIDPDPVSNNSDEEEDQEDQENGNTFGNQTKD